MAASPNRRALMLAAFVAPAMAAPAAAQVVPEADAELIAMGAHLDVALPELHRRMAVHKERFRMAQAAIDAERKARGPMSDDELSEVCLRCERAEGVNLGEADWETLCASLEPLYSRAETLRATTLAGLRAKVLLAMENYSSSGRVDEVYGLNDMLGDLQRICGVGGEAV